MTDIARDLQDAEERREERAAELARLRAELGEAQRELVVIRTQLNDARAELERAKGQLTMAEDALDAAERRKQIADRNLERAESLLAITEEQLAHEEAALREQVSRAYKYGGASSGELLVRVVQEARDPNELANNLYMLRSVVDYQGATVVRVDELRIERAEVRQQAAETRELAEAAQEDADLAHEVVERLVAEAQALVDQIARDEARQAEIVDQLAADEATKIAVLESLDAQIETERKALEEERARRVAAGATLCAVDGARVGRDFIHDWGFPRPGGRRHEGTDVFAPRGTPIRAMFDGTVKEVRRSDIGLGGLVVSYWSGPGEHWYHAHLDAIPPTLNEGDPVTAGQIIGYVGNTGNARTTPPHLHIGHYIDEVAYDPYPVLADACF